MKQLYFLKLLLAIGLAGGCSREPTMTEFDRPLAGGYHLVCTSEDEIQVIHMDDSRNLGIPAKIIEIGWNDVFIVAKQQSMKMRGDFPGDALPVPIPGAFKYWILDTTERKRFGPFSEVEFHRKVEALGQTKLKLKDVLRARKSS